MLLLRLFQKYDPAAAAGRECRGIPDFDCTDQSLLPVPVGYHSFGGWKQSLYGSHHIYGPDTIHFYTRLKAITSRWPTGIKSGAQFNFPTMS